MLWYAMEGYKKWESYDMLWDSNAMVWYFITMVWDLKAM